MKTRAVSKRFRHQLGNWGFSQLRQFITYKAKLVGVPIVFVNPRNTSRTCSQCGHCEKANRKNQATFRCKHCNFSTNADLNAARNLAGLGYLRNLASKVMVHCQ
ncbi:MAG: transposase [Patescibacteria group bacterium]|nr:transposase [Patescibacteria group bacterium]